MPKPETALTAAAALPLVTALQQNRFISIYDPPKDLNDTLNAGDLEATETEALKKIIEDVFWKPADTPFPTIYSPISDTKAILKTKFGSDENNVGMFGPWIHNKANTLEFLRGKSSTGHEPLPTGLNVAQDAGPTGVVISPKFIITGGTVLDPAGKNKDATYLFEGSYNVLPKSYIDSLSLDTAITGPISINGIKNQYGKYTRFDVSIPTNLGPNGAAYTIEAVLDWNFYPIETEDALLAYKSEADQNKQILTDSEILTPIQIEGAPYFKGNPTKNSYIKGQKKNLSTETVNLNVKRYLLVKELGDTLQVQWLNYIFELSLNEAKAAAAAEGKSAANIDASVANGTLNVKYTRGNTVIITNDTVVLYRALVNKVAVILTYKKKTKLYKSMQDGDKFIEAALILTIRKETISHNESIIKLLGDVITKAVGRDTMWLGGVSWGATKRTLATKYLTKLKERLELFNKDLDIYFNAITTSTAAKVLAARSHLLAPFVWCKTYYKQVNTVTHLLSYKKEDNTEETKLPFPAKSFSNLYLTQEKLNNNTFVNVGDFMSGGGKGAKQRGGARRILSVKIDAAKSASDEARAKGLIEASLAEFNQDWEGASYTIDPEITSGRRIEKPSAFAAIVGYPTRFVNDYNFWGMNVGDNTILTLNTTGFFLYCFVREYFPEIFDYAYLMKKAYVTARSKAAEDLGEAEAEKAKQRRAGSDSLNSATAEYNKIKAFHDLPEEPIFESFINVPSERNLKDEYDAVECEFPSLSKAKIDTSAYRTQAEAAAKATLSIKQTRDAIKLAGVYVTQFPMFQTKELSDFLAKMAEIEPAAAPSVSAEVLDIVGQGGGGSEIHEFILETAIDLHEVYYALGIQYAYEERELTNEDFDGSLRRAKTFSRIAILTPKAKQGVSSGNLGKLFGKKQLLTGMSPSDYEGESEPWQKVGRPYTVGGKYKKTRKQKKRQTKKRKTRKQK